MSRTFFYNLLAVLLLASITRAQFNFPNFVASDSLILAHDATIVGDTLRLTSATRGQGGASWYRYQQAVSDSFQTTFRFQITQRGGLGGGADGFAFVIQNSGDSVIGLDGGNIGYGGILNSLAIEFDTYDNGSIDPNNNHISIQSRGLIANNPSLIYSLGWSSTVPSFIDGAVHTAKITYARDTFRVYLDDLVTAAITSRVNLDSLLSLNAGYAWVGFTAATGNGYENHFVLDWSFANKVDTNLLGDATVFIGGIMAPPLYNSVDDILISDERVWINFKKAFLPNGDAFLNVLALNNDGTGPASIDYHIKVSPRPNDGGRTMRDELDDYPLKKYRGLIKYLESKGYKLDNMDNQHYEGENLFPFNYDWRLSLAANADSLAKFLDSVLAWTDAADINIVAHSMGGLIAKKYIKDHSQNLVKKNIIVATPHLGTAHLEHVMFTGELVGILDYAFDSDVIKNISRNMPSMYSLLPSEDYYDITFSNGISTHAGLYQKNLWADHWGKLDYQETKTFLKSLELSGEAEFNGNLIDQAYQLHDDLADVDFGTTEVYNIVGYDIGTVGSVTVYDYPVRNHTYSLKNLNGDGTVPLRSAETVNYNKTRADYYVRKVKHADLPSADGVTDLIARLLQDPPDTVGFLHPDISTSPPNNYATTGFFIKVASPVTLHAYDSQGRHTGSVSDTTSEAEIPGSYYDGGPLFDPESEKFITLPQGNSYTIRITSLDTADHFQLIIDEITDGERVGSVIYDNVSTTATTTAKLDLQTVTPQLSLQLDHNGDSLYEATVWPSKAYLSQSITAGWNLLSLPVRPNHVTVAAIYPSANSSAFIFRGGYQATDTLTTGDGYWLKFNSPETIGFYGLSSYRDTVVVTAGWNIVGGLSAPVPIDSIITNPEGIIVTNFYYFDDGYFPADTLKPGLGYWVKTNQAGKIILRAN